MPAVIREEYFKFFNEYNKVNYPAAGNPCKPVFGSLSPGCQTCVEGTWSCIYINSSCPKNCFFCPIPQNDRNKLPVVPENFFFTSVHEYIRYLKQFDFKSVSFSGGEPLLTLNRVLEYLNEIRRCFGAKHYIWAYTNGDFASEQTLALLKEAGLNELRVDIAANNYDLTAVEKAVGYIDTVSVEIPAIPEDIENLKLLLKEMQNIGVKHLNLHQLMKTKHNSDNLNQRGYSPVNEDQYPDQTPIMESELAALEILKHAIESDLDLGINYCSRCYKARFQGMAHRKRAALFCKDHKPDLTKTGYLRNIVIDASTEAAIIIKKQVKETEWEIAADGETSELAFSPDCFTLLLTEDYHKADVIYYEPSLIPAKTETTADVLPEMIAGNNICFQKDIKLRSTLDNPTSAFLFYKLFIEELSIESVTQELLQIYGLTEASGKEMIHDINEFYHKFQEVEYISPDLEPYL